MTKRRTARAGFTLIETMVYLSLFAVIMGGTVVSAYAMVESSGRNQTKAMIQAEGDYLVGKVNWALSGIQSISAPATPAPGSCTSGDTLTVTKWNGAIGNVVLALSVPGTPSNLTLARGGNPSVILNNTDVVVSALSFAHCISGSASSGTSPETVTASWTLTARTPNGMTLTQDFSASASLRK